MEAIGVAAIVGALGFTLFWVQLKRGDEERARDRAEWQCAGYRDELGVATAKLEAQSKTIIALERLVVESDGDSRALLGVVSEHRRMLSESDHRPPTHNDGLSAGAPPAGDADHESGVRAGSEVLEHRGGDGDSGLRDPRELMGGRSPGVPGGGPVED